MSKWPFALIAGSCVLLAVLFATPDEMIAKYITTSDLTGRDCIEPCVDTSYQPGIRMCVQVTDPPPDPPSLDCGGGSGNVCATGYFHYSECTSGSGEECFLQSNPNRPCAVIEYRIVNCTALAPTAQHNWGACDYAPCHGATFKCPSLCTYTPADDDYTFLGNIECLF